MEFQSTASQSLHNQIFADEPAPMTAYLINTMKVLKGHKLKTRDFIKQQLMKFRRCSPVKYDELNRTDFEKHREEFKKFKGFGDQAKEEIHKIVSGQRQKLSRETKDKIKLFNNTKINSMFEESMPLTSEKLSVKSKPMTSEPSRSANKQVNSYKTIANDTTVSGYRERRKNKKPIVFRSENLGVKMNEQLNLYLSGQKDEAAHWVEKTIPMTLHREIDAREEVRHSQTIDMRRKPNLAFIRRMKRHHKQKTDSGKVELLAQFKSQQLVKPRTACPLGIHRFFSRAEDKTA